MDWGKFREPAHVWTKKSRKYRTHPGDPVGTEYLEDHRSGVAWESLRILGIVWVKSITDVSDQSSEIRGSAGWICGAPMCLLPVLLLIGLMLLCCAYDSF